MAIGRHQRRHISIDIGGAIGEGRLCDNLRRIHKIANNLIANRLVIGHEGGEAIEVKLQVNEGLRVEHEEHTEIADVGAHASVSKKKLIVLLTIRIIMLDLQVVIYTADVDPVIIRRGRVLAREEDTDKDRGHLCYDDDQGRPRP